MRATVLAPAVLRHDATGNYVVRVVRTLRDEGYDVRLLVEHAEDVPADLAAVTRRVADPEDVARGGGGDDGAHLAASALVVVIYSVPFPLARVLQLSLRGLKVFDYLGVTPAALWRGAGRDALVRGAKEAVVAREAAVRFASSRFGAAELAASAGIDAGSVVVAGFPVETSRFAAAAPARRTASDPFRVLYVGRVAPSKRVDRLVEALARLRKDGVNATLTLVGDAASGAYGACLEEVISRARDVGVADSLVVRGRVSDEELVRAYAAADVFATATLHEGFCVPIAEAMASGLPVVATTAGALPEVAGDAAVLVPPDDSEALADALLRLARDPAEALRRGDAGRSRAAAHDVARWRERWLGALRSAGLPRAPAPAVPVVSVSAPTATGRPYEPVTASVEVRCAGPGEVPAGTSFAVAWCAEDGSHLADATAVRVPRTLAARESVALSVGVCLPARAGRFRLRVGAASDAPSIAFTVAGDPVSDADAGTRLARLAESAADLPVYRDTSHHRGIWRLAARLRAAMTRHVVRTHVDVIARRHGEVLAALAEEVRRLHARLAADEAAREAERRDRAGRGS